MLWLHVNTALVKEKVIKIKINWIEKKNAKNAKNEVARCKLVLQWQLKLGYHLLCDNFSCKLVQTLVVEPIVAGRKVV